ncbi:MAG: hypothetical protein LUE93_00990 [Bacteroides sp.]|nr:hypothetical protein [Bacteroides sp.]
MIRYRNENDKTYLQAIGNIIENQEVELTYNDTYNNGFVYTVDKALEYSARNTLAGDARWSNPSLYEFIQEYVAQNPEASLFLDYLNATRVSSDGNISRVGTGAYTILFPSNASIRGLIDQGILVEPDSPKLNQSSTEFDNEMRNKVSNFVLTHFLSGYVMPDDGLPGIMISNGNYYEDGLRVNSTLRVTEAALGVVNERMFVDVSKQGGRLAFSPRDFSEDGKVLISGIGGGVVIPGLTHSNYIGPRSVFHLIDGYLLFEANITE